MTMFNYSDITTKKKIQINNLHPRYVNEGCPVGQTTSMDTSNRRGRQISSTRLSPTGRTGKSSLETQETGNYCYSSISSVY